VFEANCVFCKITKGEIPAKKYYEDDNFLAIYDINPISEGHLVVFSKNHYSNVSEMPDEELQKMIILARSLAEKHIKEIETNSYHLLINQGEAASKVPHRPHIHIIPRKFDDGLKIDPR
jgi:diadenosine tetraphosphate (Ap4A) HIT family hydrolase